MIRHLTDIGRWCARGALQLAGAYAVIVVLSAILFAAFEHRSMADALYWAFTTAMTVGYGDISPATIGGRVTAVLLMHLAPMIIIPLVTARLASQLIVDNDAFTHGEQEEIKATLQRLEKKVDPPIPFFIVSIMYRWSKKAADSQYPTMVELLQEGIRVSARRRSSGIWVEQRVITYQEIAEGPGDPVHQAIEDVNSTVRAQHRKEGKPK